MNIKTLEAIRTAAISAGLCVLAIIVIYTVYNESGHTGFDPYLALIVFIPVTVAGIAFAYGCRKNGQSALPGIITAIIGVAGILLLIYLDRTNTLLQYDVWLQRGMP